MRRHFLIHDLKHSMLSSIFLSVMIIITSILLTSAFNLSLNLYISISNFTQASQTPDLLFMHQGEIDSDRLQAFGQEMKDQGLVDHFQILPFINFDNHQLNFGPLSMENNSQDNGFTIQGESFDYLLGQNNEILNVKQGEIYFPLHFEHPDLFPGQRVEVAGLKLVFKGYLRDSQMNPPLASSKRFLVSKKDLDILKSKGTIEYLIEFKCPRKQEVKEVERRYLDTGLPANGPTLTGPLFKLINALSDGIIIFVILFASGLVILVAYLVLTYTVKENLAQDFQTLAIMKAIGLRDSDLRALFQTKYLTLSILATTIGIAVSPLLTQPVSQNIHKYMGQVETSLTQVFLYNLVSFVLINMLILTFIRHQLKRFKKIKPIMGLRQNTFNVKSVHPRPLIRLKGIGFSPNLQLAIQAIRSNLKSFIIQAMTLTLVIMVMVIPSRLSASFSDPKFAQQLGMGDYHLLISNQSADNNLAITTYLDKNTLVKAYDQMVYSKFKISTRDNTFLLTQMGDHSLFPIHYSQGTYPVTDQQIALSSLVAQDLGFKLGDSIQLQVGDRIEVLEVSGIYSDITNGGKSAKITSRDRIQEVALTRFGLQLRDSSQMDNMKEKINQIFPNVRVNDIETQMTQMYGPIQRALKRLSLITYLIGTLLVLLISYLTLNMTLIREHKSLKHMREMGFRKKDIFFQHLFTYYLLVLIIFVSSTFLIETIGQTPAKLFLASMGSQGLIIKPLPVIQFGLTPIVVLALMTLVNYYLVQYHLKSTKQAKGGH